MNKPENEKSIKLLTQLRELDTKKNKDLYNTAISALEQPTATEFLQKAKAICKYRGERCRSNNGKEECPVRNLCIEAMSKLNEADLVRKVMDYQIKEDRNEESNN